MGGYEVRPSERRGGQELPKPGGLDAVSSRRHHPAAKTFLFQVGANLIERFYSGTSNWPAVVFATLAAFLGGCTQGSCVDARRSPNVVLITVDTLRADRLPTYGYDEISTPHLSRLAGDAIVFEQAHAHAPITLPSHASILTGLYPPEHGVRNNGSYVASEQLLTLAEVMSAEGYDTAAFVSAFVLDRRFGLDQGFGTYDDEQSNGGHRFGAVEIPQRRGEFTVDAALRWLSLGRRAPIFLWLHLYDPHFPYDAPAPFGDADDPYDGEIAYVDSQIGRVLEAMKAAGTYDPSLIVLTSDHGESLGEHGESTHSVFVYESTQHVPLFIKLPDNAGKGGRIQDLVRHIDLLPTMLDLVAPGRSATYSGQGVALLKGPGTMSNLTSYAEAYVPFEDFGWSPLFSLRTREHKYIEAPVPELYDLVDDAEELHNVLQAISAAPPQEVRQLSKELGRLQEATRAANNARHQPDAETLHALEALGYVANTDAVTDGEGPSAGRDPKHMIDVLEGQRLATSLIASKAFERAAELLEGLIEKDAGNARLHRDLGTSYAATHRFEEADVHFRKAIALRPGAYRPYAGLAAVFLKGRSDHQQAERYLDMAFRLEPDAPSLWGLRGELLHEQGKYEEAADAFRQCYERGDRTSSFLVSYASTLNHLGVLPRALEVARLAVAVDERSAMAHYNLGVILKNLGEPRKAEAALRKALDGDAYVPQVWAGLEAVMASQNRLPELQERLESWLEEHPEDAEAAYWLGSLHLKAARTPQAIPWLELAARRRPIEPAAMTNLSVAYAGTGRMKRAVSTLGRLLAELPSDSPHRAETWLRIAQLEIERDNAAAARRALDSAFEAGDRSTRRMALRTPAFRSLLKSR